MTPKMALFAGLEGSVLHTEAQRAIYDEISGLTSHQWMFLKQMHFNPFFRRTKEILQFLVETLDTRLIWNEREKKEGEGKREWEGGRGEVMEEERCGESRCKEEN